MIVLQLMMIYGTCEKSLSAQVYHKEESPTRKTADKVLRNKIKQKLSQSIDPLDPSQDNNWLVNIVTGEVMQQDTLNVERAVDIQLGQLEAFEGQWPELFNQPISKQVVTMTASRRYLNLIGHQIIDHGILYGRAMGLHASGRPVDLDGILEMSCQLYRLLCLMNMVKCAPQTKLF